MNFNHQSSLNFFNIFDLEFLLSLLHVIHLLLPLHHLLLGHLCFFSYLWADFFLVLLPFFGLVFPDNLEHFFRIIRSDGWSDPATFKNNLDESLFVFPLAIKREPVVKILSADSPSVGDPVGVDKSNGFHFREEDSFGGS